LSIKEIRAIYERFRVASNYSQFATIVVAELLANWLLRLLPNRSSEPGQLIAESSVEEAFPVGEDTLGASILSRVSIYQMM
jgi:hypothetical protein